MDIVTANFGSDTIGIFLADRNGSFINQTTYSTGSSSSPYFVNVGYVNNDTNLDIIVVNYYNNKYGVFLGPQADKDLEKRVFTRQIRHFNRLNVCE